MKINIIFNAHIFQMSTVETDSSSDESAAARSPLLLSEISENTKETRKFQQCKCKRLARKNCSQQACAQCCTDSKCEGHREHRMKESIVQGSHPIQVLVKKIRSLDVGQNIFREKAFKYLGETVVIWNFHEYMGNPKWREESIRKSKRNVLITLTATKSGRLSKETPFKEGRRKRFKRVMKKLHNDSISSF